MSERMRSGVEPSGTGQLRVVIGAFYLGLIGVVVAAVFAGRAANGLAVAVATKPTPKPTPSIPVNIAKGGVFRDPHHLFTLAIPKGWHILITTSKGSEGDRTGAATYPIYSFTIVPPPTDHAHSGDVFAVREYPLLNAFMRGWECSGQHTPNSTVAGLPAFRLNGNANQWLLNTENANYFLTLVYPGASVYNPGGVDFIPGNPSNPKPTATPLPPGYAAANKALMVHLFATFLPTPAKPLICGA